MQVCFPHYFSYMLLFFCRKFPPPKKGKDEYETCISLATAGFRCCLTFSEKALATQQDQLTVFMEQLEIYQKIQRQLVCSKANEVGEPQRFLPKNTI